MKKLRSILTILFFSLVLGGMISCEVTSRTDNGRHRGWFHRHENRHHRDRSVIIVGGEERGYQSDDRDWK